MTGVWADFDFFGVTVRVTVPSAEDLNDLRYFYESFEQLQATCPDISIVFSPPPDICMSLFDCLTRPGLAPLIRYVQGDETRPWPWRDTPVPPFRVPPLAGRFLLLHASALIPPRSNKAVLFTGSYYHGKTTLALALVTQGARFLTDDLAVIDRNTLMVWPFPKPIGVRERTVPRIPDLARRLTQVDNLRSYVSAVTGRLWMVAIDRLYPDCGSREPAAVRTLVLLTPGDGSYPRLRSLRPATAVARLMAHRKESGLPAEESIDVLCRLVRVVPCYELLADVGRHTLAGICATIRSCLED